MATSTLHIDIAIIGGGIAGLWALNRLRNSGYSAVLFEQEALGGYQTIASQGIIHGGIKYALAGVPDANSRTLSAMPQVWRDCLAGIGGMDLRDCRVLSEHLYLWSNADLPSRLSAYLSGSALRSTVTNLPSSEFPEPLRSADFRGRVYRVAEQVLDMPSLLGTLAAAHRQAIFRIDWGNASLQQTHGRASLALPHCTVLPQRLLLSAGTGNEALIARLGGAAPAMQRRPLQQVMVKHQYEPSFYGHCIGSQHSPRLTVTSHRTAAGEPVWYLGGDLATSRAQHSAEQLIDTAQRELATLLPWLELGTTQWRTVQLDRAEPRQRAGLRPHSAFVGSVAGVGNALVAWPTKLSLCPALGDEIELQLRDQNIRPRHPDDLSLLQPLGQPPLAQPCWDTLFS